MRWVDAEGPATQITHISEAPRNAKWSPDGKSIAFSMFVPATDKWTISHAGRAEGREMDAGAARRSARIHYRQDQVGYLEDGFTHLFVVPADGGTARQLTTGKWSVGAGELRGGASIDWTPDSKSIVFDGNRSPDADMQYETSQIYVADVATGAVRELVTQGRASGASRSSRRTAAPWRSPATRRPDTRTRSATCTSSRSPAARGDMRKISGDFDRDPINMRWAPDGTGRVLRRRRPRRAQRRRSRRSSAASSRSPSGRQMLTFDSVSKDGIAAGTAADLDHPQDVVKFNVRQPGQVTRLTDVNGDVLQGMQLAKDRGDHLHLERQRQGDGLDRQAADVRSRRRSTR